MSNFNGASERTCWSTSMRGRRWRNLQVVGAHRTRRCARLVCQDAVGAVRRVRAAAFAGRLGHSPHQGCRRGSSPRRRTRCTAHGLVGHRTADQLRDDVLGSAPARGTAGCRVAGIPELYIDVPRQLGTTAAGRHGRRPCCRSGTPGSPCRIVRFSSAFDARGRKLGWLPATDSGVLVVDVPLDSRTTLYDRLGDRPIMLALLTFAVWCAGVSREWLRRHR